MVGLADLPDVFIATLPNIVSLLCIHESTLCGIDHTLEGKMAASFVVLQWGFEVVKNRTVAKASWEEGFGKQV